MILRKTQDTPLLKIKIDLKLYSRFIFSLELNITQVISYILILKRYKK